MKNKQINVDSQNQSSRLSNEPAINGKLQNAIEEKLKGVKYTDSITFKDVAKLTEVKKPPPKTKDKPLVSSSIIRQQVSTTLPIAINQLQEKTLNQYLRQFMQISTFQSAQKGKQLIDLVKQSPMSKQSQWVVNKLIKLFKSSIPEAVLCSFQFIRELIEIGSNKIVQMIEEALLMPLVQIIEYRSYITNIERGNSYFLSSFYRYSSDDKTNHLIKIGSTFFKMAHQALYVWGNIYFPQSNFNKMLSKLMITNKIAFPSNPHQFKFYSKTRIDLFLALMETKTKKAQKSIQKISSSKKSQPKSKEQIPTSKVNQQQSPQMKSVSKKAQQKSPLKITTSKQHQEKISSPKKIQEQNKQRQSLNQLISKQLQQKKTSTPQITKNQQQEQTLNNPKASQQQKDELQCIQLTKPSPLKKQDKQPTPTEPKIQLSFKKLKASKIKDKEPSIPMLKKQMSSEISVNFCNLEDIDDPLNLIKQPTMRKRQINSQFQPNEQHQVMTLTNKKQSIDKQLLKIDLGRLNGNNRKPSSSVIRQHQASQQHITTAQQVAINNLTNNQTFRPLLQPSQKDNMSSERQRYLIGQNQSSQGVQTARVQSTQRQRFNFNYSMTEQSEDRAKNSVYKSNPNSDRLPQTNVVTEFLKKEFQMLKNTLICEIKKDIISTIQSSTQNNQHVNFNLHKQIVKDQETLVENLFKNQTNEDSDPHSGRFGEKSNQQITPSTQAMQFVKKKLSNGKKLRAASKRQRHSIVKDLQVNDQENQEDECEKIKKQSVPDHQNKVKNTMVQSGVNTEELTNQKLYEELSSLRQKIHLVTGGKQNAIKNFTSSNKRQNSFFSSRISSNLFSKTPNTINKNQEQLKKFSQFSSLRSTCNSLRKISNSKLSERRSSAESMIIQKALLKSENCQNELQQIFGGPNTLLFNAALNSVKKKRPSIMFC